MVEKLKMDNPKLKCNFENNLKCNLFRCELSYHGHVISEKVCEKTLILQLRSGIEAKMSVNEMGF